MPTRPRRPGPPPQWFSASPTGRRKSSRSAYHIACVEVADLEERGVALRDSRNPDQGDLQFTPAERAPFREGVRSGEFG
ncbi:DUF397 domain-containing protein [Streptomyces chrestomyceticus]|uniref:DUF397 domain-containing protein n=1 Tax=Streptomyces chrestomyceticus TaxID=68185 RepID=UPI0036C06D5A